MRAYSLLAAAKVNLHLEILGARSDGYHEMNLVLQSIDLMDQVDLRPIGTATFRVKCDHPDVPADQGNLAYRAAMLMAQEFPDAFAKYGGVAISIHKQIPVGAGLAGGSTNAAAVLVGLDMMWQLGLTQAELQQIAAQLGSDIPFCVSGGTALATGRGEQLDPLPDMDHLWVVLAKPRQLAISTAWAYGRFREEFGDRYPATPEEMSDRKHHARSQAMIAAIARRDDSKIGQLLYNDLEKVVIPAHESLQRLRAAFEQAEVLGTLMSGSGATMFALVSSESQAQQVYAQIKATIADPTIDFWITRFASTSIRIRQIEAS